MPPAPLRGHLWIVKMLEFIGIPQGPADQSTIKDSNAARASARLLWRSKNAWNSLEFLKGPTDQSTIRDSNAARASAKLL